ncbi:MAG: hypothetical protein FJ086_14140, partial [Deltaproteobacteria bacterium]|nr:hypothetical protein [Deltaproteobacteria bacterium]
MGAWIIGYQKSVKDAAPGVTAEAWARWDVEAPEPPPAPLRALYSAFDGGALTGGVKLHRFERVVEHRNDSELSAWLFGAKGDRRLLAARKATLAAHPGLMSRPSWFESTAADAPVFATHDVMLNAVRVYPSLEQLLAVMVPPAQLEAFGDHTYASAMKVMEDVLDSVTGPALQSFKDEPASPVKKPVQPKAGKARAAAARRDNVVPLRPATQVKSKPKPVPKKAPAPVKKQQALKKVKSKSSTRSTGKKSKPMAAKKSVKKPVKKAAPKKAVKKAPVKKAAPKKPAK